MYIIKYKIKREEKISKWVDYADHDFINQSTTLQERYFPFSSNFFYYIEKVISPTNMHHYKSWENKYHYV